MEREPIIEQIEGREATEMELMYKQVVGGDPEEIIVIDGEKYRKKIIMQSLQHPGKPITEKEYYYHPGPGWDLYNTYLRALCELTDRAEKRFPEYLIEKGAASILSDKTLYKLVLLEN
jgi:hypothetical protein